MCRTALGMVLFVHFSLLNSFCILDSQPQSIFCQICMNLRIGSVVRCGRVWRLQCELHLDVLIILDKRENLEISAYLLHADASLQASFFSQ